MIKLQDPVRIGPFRLFRDSEDPKRLWRLPPPPTLLEVDGRPAGVAALYRGEPSAQPYQGGAWFSFPVDLARFPDARTRAETGLNALAQPPEVVDTAPLAGGMLRLECGGTLLAESPVPAGVRIVAVSGVVAPDGAKALRSGIEDGPGMAALLSASIEVRFDGPVFEIQLHGAAEAVRRAGPTLGAARVNAMVDELIEDGRVVLTTRAPIESEMQEMQELAALLVAGALFEPAPAEIGWSGIPGLASPEGALLRLRQQIGDVDLTVPGNGAAVKVPFFAACHVQPGNDLARVELPSPQIRCVHVRPAVSPEAVSDDLDLEFAFPDGGAARVVFERARLADQPTQTLRYALGDPPDYTYRWRYARGEWFASSDGFLTLDGGPWRVRNVRVMASMVNWNWVRRLKVRLQAEPDQEATEIVLTHERQEDEWSHAIGVDRDGSYTWETEFETPDDHRLAGARGEATTDFLCLDDPFAGSWRVLVIAAGVLEIDELSRLEVDLDYEDSEHQWSRQGRVTLTVDSPRANWSVPLLDRDLRRYRYRVRTVYVDGNVQEGEWCESDRALLVIRSPAAAWLRVNLYSLWDSTAPENTKRLEVILRHDETEPRWSRSGRIVLTREQPDGEWRAPLLDPEHHAYVYQVLTVLVDGSTTTSPWRETEERALVFSGEPSPA